MKHVCIGIYVHTEPEHLHATLANLQANSSQPVVLLPPPNGPDEMTSPDLAALRDLPQSNTAELLGLPACLNRLAVSADISDEATIFLRQGIRRGTCSCWLSNNGLSIYLRHTSKSWSFTCDQYLNSQSWQRLDEPLFASEEPAFYVAPSSAAPMAWPDTSQQPLGPPQPLVSCIMPTANRRMFVPQAIQCFLQQDYANRELIVVDDGTDVVADLIPPSARIRYVRLEGKYTIGAKRNLACQEAKGKIIVHWDDDDWMANWRLSYQVASLLKEQADLCGLDKVLYYDIRSGQAWQYIYPMGRRPWIAGNTLCYTKAFWQGNPFPNLNVGEDTRFLWSNHPKRILSLQDMTFYIALIHPGNTSPKQLQDECWHSYPAGEIRKLMGGDWTFDTDPLQRR